MLPPPPLPPPSLPSPPAVRRKGLLPSRFAQFSCLLFRKLSICFEILYLLEKYEFLRYEKL